MHLVKNMHEILEKEYERSSSKEFFLNSLSRISYPYKTKVENVDHPASYSRIYSLPGFDKIKEIIDNLELVKTSDFEKLLKSYEDIKTCVKPDRRVLDFYRWNFACKHIFMRGIFDKSNQKFKTREIMFAIEIELDFNNKLPTSIIKTRRHLEGIQTKPYSLGFYHELLSLISKSKKTDLPKAVLAKIEPNQDIPYQDVYKYGIYFANDYLILSKEKEYLGNQDIIELNKVSNKIRKV